MKSFCASALVLLVSCGWAAGQETDPQDASQSTSLLPLPAINSVGVITASYNLPATGMDPHGSIFTSQQESAPKAEAGDVIDGAGGPSSFEQSVTSEWSDCDECSQGGGGWFGSFGALVMGRNRPDPYWTTYETGNVTNQLFNTQDAGANWTGGWQVTAGYMFGGCDGCDDCCRSCCSPCGGCGVNGPGIGFTYWGLGQMPGFAQINSPTDELSTTIDMSGVDINGVAAGDYFNDSASHRIWRNDRVNNFEANLYFGAWNYSRWTVVPFAGFRYFRFDERLAFGGLAGGGDWSDPADSAYLSFRTVNNLYGAQVGTYANYWISDRFSLFIGPKVGLFANQMNDRTLLYDGQGNVEYDIAAHKSDFSLLGEVDFGMTYFLRRNVFTYLGYRVVGITNVALGDNQFLPFLADEQGFAQVKQSGSLILHGVMMGGGWMF